MAFMVDSEWLNLAVLEVGKVSWAQEGCDNFSLTTTGIVKICGQSLFLKK